MHPNTLANNNGTTLQNITFVKTILMLSVVFYHSLCFWSGSWFTAMSVAISAPVLSTIGAWLNSFHIYGFTFVSGYLFYYLRYEKGKYREFAPYFTGKINRLLIPYLFVTAIWVAPIGHYFFQYTASEFSTKYVLGVSPGQLWFLLMLFHVYIIFYFLGDFLNQYFLLGAGVTLAFYGIGLIWGRVLPNWYQIGTAFQYVPFFWLGFETRKNNDNILKVPSAVWIILHIGLFIVTQYLATRNGLAVTVARLGLSFLLHLVGATMAFCVLQKIATCIKWNTKYFHFLSKRAMVIYLFHQQVIYVCIALFNGKLHPYTHIIINFIVAVLVSSMIAGALMKFKYMRFLVGEK